MATSETLDIQNIDFGFGLNFAEAQDFNSNEFGLNTSIDIDTLICQPCPQSTYSTKTVCQPIIPSLNQNSFKPDDEYFELQNQLKDYRGYV